MPVDYSKWDHIDISDDEDDVHPNVDTPSLFRWRHEARVKKEDEEKQERARKNAEEKLRLQKLGDLKKKVEDLEAKDNRDEGENSQLQSYKDQAKELEDQQAEFKQKEKELEEFQKAHPNWNVDNMSSDKHNRTLINKSKPKTVGVEMEMQSYFKEHGEEVKKFGMLSKYEEAHQFLKQRMYLVCEHLASYLVIWAVDLEVEKKDALMQRVARQAIVAQYILELSKTLKRDPRSCVDPFFTRIQTAEAQYLEAFEDEYNSLLARVKKRAIERLEEAREEVEKEEEEARKARLGPGGLDPIEVLKELPENLRKAFSEQNDDLLKASFAALSEDEAKVVYKKVVDSGLWVPAAGGDEASAASNDASEAKQVEEVD
jgi:cell division cycle protein 37